MIPSSTVWSFAVAALFTVALPVALFITLGVKKRIGAVPALVGAAAFFLSQMVLRLPIIGMLSAQSWYAGFAAQFFPYALVLALSAGVFEESARLGGAFLLPKYRNYKGAVSFGLGHALCEVLLLAGASHINTLFACLMINNGDGAAILPAETLEAAAAQLAAVQPFDVAMGILERFSAVAFHVFATVLVFRGVVEKKLRFYFLAVLAHTLFNFTAVLLAQFAGIAVTEAVLLAAGLAMAVYAVKCRGRFAAAAQGNDPA